MDTNLKSTEAKGTDVFKGAISWICSLLLLCGLTTGLLVLLFIALDPQLAGGLGEAFINLTYGEYPRWLPVAAVSVILFVAALLALLFAFRKDRHDFENMLAAWLAKIWVEVKLLVIVAVVLVAILLDFGTTLGGMITPVVAVVFLYFLCLDIGKNRQFFRHNIVHSLLKALNSYRDLTGFEQRSLRRLLSTLAVIVGVLGVSAATFLSLLRVAQSPIRDFFLLGVVGFAAAGVIGSIFWYTLALKRDLRDWSVLLAQIAEMYGGNLNAVNHIPPTSNLYDCAMQLNMIRTGIQKAVEEGIKADRTKVELITNVSHDIKTPLTSIISYVELLKREPDLPPHVMDYIKTISQKADRLNHIVQDVFEVSKAATGNGRIIRKCRTKLPHNRPVSTGNLHRLQILLDYIHEHYSAPLSLTDLAAQIPMSRENCCRFFRQMTGCTISEYLNDYRISRSIHLMKTSDQSISAIAALTGFSSASRFAAAFRAKTGLLPSEYRRNHSTVS